MLHSAEASSSRFALPSFCGQNAPCQRSAELASEGRARTSLSKTLNALTMSFVGVVSVRPAMMDLKSANCTSFFDPIGFNASFLRGRGRGVRGGTERGAASSAAERGGRERACMPGRRGGGDAQLVARQVVAERPKHAPQLRHLQLPRASSVEESERLLAIGLLLLGERHGPGAPGLGARRSGRFGPGTCAHNV